MGLAETVPQGESGDFRQAPEFGKLSNSLLTPYGFAGCQVSGRLLKRALIGGLHQPEPMAFRFLILKKS